VARINSSLLSLRGRIGAYRLHATHDPRATTASAREAFLKRFLDEVDPQRELPELERDRRALAARQAHFARLAYLSAKARSHHKVAPAVSDQSAGACEEGQSDDNLAP
jgi:hypothetical protein